MKKKLILIPVFIILLLFLAFILFYEQREVGYVSRVLDGDTIELNTTEKVRLIGINSPERGKPFYEEAKAELEKLILEKKVYMEKDKEGYDRYGRLLRYVYIDGYFVNLKMIEKGFGTVYIIPPNEKYETMFRQTEQTARENGLGVWSLVSKNKCVECIFISDFNWNAEGNDCNNPNGEWVSFGNLCSFDCELTGWVVKDEGRNTYTFPDFTFKSKSFVTLYTGEGIDTETTLYWNNTGSCKAVWNNDGDTLYLRDPDDGLILMRHYSG